MRRREFLIATSLTAAGLAIGLSQSGYAGDEPPKVSNRGRRQSPISIKYPHGGCTESSIVSFDRGPFGSDPYGIYA